MNIDIFVGSCKYTVLDGVVSILLLDNKKHQLNIYTGRTFNYFYPSLYPKEKNIFIFDSVIPLFIYSPHPNPQNKGNLGKLSQVLKSHPHKASTEGRKWKCFVIDFTSFTTAY